MKTITAILTSITALLFLTVTAQAVSPGAKAPDFTLTAADGKTHSLSDFEGKHVVLEWVNFGCPFVKKHYSVGNMQMLQEKYTEQGIVWLAICSSAEGKQGYMEGEHLQKKLKMHDFSGTAYLIDESGQVGQAYGAKRTPEMFLISPDGTVLYHGAIDSNSSANSDDIEGATNYVVEAIEAAKTGAEIPNPSTKPYGCGVKY